MRCPYCTKEIAEEAIACPHCTRDLQFFQPITQQVTAFQKDMETRIAALETQVTTLAVALSSGTIGPAVTPGGVTAMEAGAAPAPPPGHARSYWPAYAAIGLTFLIIYLLAFHEETFLGFEMHLLFSCLAFYLLAGLWFAFIERGKHFGRYVKTGLIMGVSVGVGIPLAVVISGGSTLDEILYNWEPIPVIVLAVAFAYVTGCLIGDFLEGRRKQDQSAPYAMRVAQRALAASLAAQQDTDARDRSINRLAKIIEALGPIIGIAGTILTAMVSAWLSKGGG